MDRMIKCKINGQERYLNYSIEVMFDAIDKFGTASDMLQKIGEETREGFEALRWMIVHLVNDAELSRREQGYDPLPMLQENDISARMLPLDYKELQSAVIEAIAYGYNREVENPEEETDLGLAELNQKKTKAD